MPSESEHNHWMVSPHYSVQSLQDGTVDPVTVFEDQVKEWVFAYAQRRISGFPLKRAALRRL